MTTESETLEAIRPVASVDLRDSPLRPPAAQPAGANTGMSPANGESASITPMGMIARHIEHGGGMDQLERLLELQKSWEAHEARKAFYAAMADFSADPPFITKNKRVDFTSNRGRTTYDHATLDEIAHKVAAKMAPHGLSFRWDTDNSQVPMRVTCIVSHRAGHREHTTLYGPADNSGNKNDLQAIGSGVTYLERYTLKAALGLAESDQDDDGQKSSTAGPGRKAGGAATISDEQEMQITAALEENETVTRNGFFLKLRRLMPDNKPPNSIGDIPAAIFTESLAIAEGRQR